MTDIVERLRDRYGGLYRLIDMLKEKDAEIERLRAALRKVSCSCWPEPGCSKGRDCKEFIARAALGEDK